jgi:hypothetical protein
MAKQPVSPAPDPDSAEAARLRVAHDVLDERPSPAVRAAVLRAAAESVRGAPSTGTVRAPREHPARRWFGWRPAAAASATVAVGLLAVGIATHVERQTSTATPMEGRSETTPAPVAAPPPYEAAPAASPMPSYNSAPATPSRADAPAAKSKAFARTRDEFNEGKPAAAAEAPAKETRQAVSPEPAGKKMPQAVSSEPPSEAAKDTVAPAPPVEEEKRAVAPESTAGAAARAQSRAMQAPATEAIRREAIPQPAAPLAKPLSQDQAGALGAQAGKERFQPPASPEEWLRRIIELRRAGRSGEADEELTRFRAAFPNVKVPDDALR